MEALDVVTIGAWVTILVSIYNIQNSRKKDTKQDAIDNVTLREELKYISKGVEEIKYDTRSFNAIISKINERVGRTEEAVRHLNSRLDQHLSESHHD